MKTQALQTNPGLAAPVRSPHADDATSTPALNPPLKWAGGKRWQVPHLRPIWELNADRRLVDPFCGGLAVTLGPMPRRALLNDINPHVISQPFGAKSGSL